MSSNVQPESAWHMHRQNSIVHGDADTLGDGKGVVVYPETCRKEHDYIGLSGTSSTITSMEQTTNFTKLDSKECSQDNECRDTELRLGIGPYGKETSRLHTHQQSGLSVPSEPHHHLLPVNQMSQDGLKALYGCPEGGTGNGSVDFHQSFWPWSPGVAPGRFTIPVPKVSMVPAKRSYFEVRGENNNSSMCTLATTNSNSSLEALMLERSNQLGSSSAPPLPTPATFSQRCGGVFYAWSCGNTMPTAARAAWQQENCDRTGMDGATHTENSAFTRPLPPPSLYSPCSAPLVDHNDPMPPSIASKSTVTPHFRSSEQTASHTTDVRKEDASRDKAPMVGWPPVRSFRRNTLQSAAGGKENGALSDLHKQEKVSNVNEPVADPLINGSSRTKDALFVKAKLDGVRICRKVDLTAYSSYDSLKSALQEMFEGFVSNDNTKFDLVHGSNHVLTHEDKDGDWMLVGDVPWRMFATTVKSLRIMKAADAVGLGKGTNQSQRS